MAERRRFQGKDVPDALRTAAVELGIPAERLAYGLLEAPRRGMFGLGKRVRIWAEAIEPGATSPAAALEASFEIAEARALGARWLQATVERIVTLMGFELRVAVTPGSDSLRVELTGPDEARLRADEGELLDALQFLLNRIAGREQPELGRIRFESGGFRQERDEDLIELARETARQVALTGKARWLPPLNPYERRLVHVAVEAIGGVATASSGEGFLKRIRITPTRQAGKA